MKDEAIYKKQSDSFRLDYNFSARLSVGIKFRQMKQTIHCTKERVKEEKINSFPFFVNYK